MTTTPLQQATTAAKKGKLIIFPTDTQYALGCTLTNPKSIQQVYTIKKRPPSLPLPIAVSSIPEIQTVAQINPTQTRIAKKFLPGPLTMVLKKQPSISPEITANQDSIAIRIPDHPLTIALLKETGPLIITSANIHGQKPYQDIKDIQQQFGDKITIYLPGGTLNMPPSTIIDFTKKPPILLRQGPISLKEVIKEMTS